MRPFCFQPVIAIIYVYAESPDARQTNVPRSVESLCLREVGLRVLLSNSKAEVVKHRSNIFRKMLHPCKTSVWRNKPFRSFSKRITVLERI